jgi:hypothetical protein
MEFGRGLFVELIRTKFLLEVFINTVEPGSINSASPELLVEQMKHAFDVSTEIARY